MGEQMNKLEKVRIDRSNMSEQMNKLEEVILQEAKDQEELKQRVNDNLLTQGKITDGYRGKTIIPDPVNVKEMQEIRKLQEAFHAPDYMSKKIIKRFQDEGVKFYCNDNISEHVTEGELELIEKEVAANFDNLLRSLLIDVDKDHNTKETGKRVAKMFIQEVFRGRYFEEPKITAFPNVAYDGAYYTGPISIRSTCAHHFQNITGSCWIGVKPHKEVIGLSKFNRIVDHIASRPQIQEEMTTQIADRIEKLTETENIAIMIKAQHHCLTHRGVREHDSDMTTTILRGTFKHDSNTRSEFFSTVNNMKGHN